MKFYLFLLGPILLLSINAAALTDCEASFQSTGIETWLETQVTVAKTKVLENISRPDGLPGAIIAARTRSEPDYYFHWIRDAGLVVEAILGPARTGDTRLLAETRHKVLEYVAFSKRLQNLETLTGLGEPKVHVDGTAINGPWGR
ncbi:MAG: glycoside hydrolase family 15 protein, partial [Bdellovibrionales bacterium]|nr:glycoside hydrolase family 15 protein [Bdellovibrionales bacterium]